MVVAPIFLVSSNYDRFYCPTGTDVEIRGDFRKFVKDDQFQRAADVADVAGLSLQQVAEREGHILKVNHP